jgi:transposase
MGRSRGGLTTKIHALVDTNGLPIALKLTAGQAHDGRGTADMLDTLGDGDVLLADRAYDSDALRTELAARAPGPTSSPCRTASNAPSSAPSSIDTATSSSASSANSSSSGPW